MSQNNNQNKMVTCKHCGQKYSPQRTYCPYCHKDASGNSDGYTPLSDKALFIIRLAVGAVLLVGFVLLYVFVLNK